jgi:hypothetical protein
MIRTRRSIPTARRGYAMAAVIIFLALMLALVAICQRELATVLRIKRARAQVEQRDEGAVDALARALQLLETGLPPSDPYVCGTDEETPVGVQSYTVTFTSTGIDQWAVAAVPTPPDQSPAPMPDTFAP